MKIYTYYLKGTEINVQYSCKPKWFILRFRKYAWLLHIWRLQVVVCPNLSSRQ